MVSKKLPDLIGEIIFSVGEERLMAHGNPNWSGTGTIMLHTKRGERSVWK